MSNGDYTEPGLVASTTLAFLRAERDAQGPKPTALGTSMRASAAMGCERQLALDAARVPECEDIGYETLLAFRLGEAILDLVQGGVAAMFADFVAEVPVDLRTFGFDVSGSADGVLIEGSELTVHEIKTMGGFAFNMAVEADAPKLEHILQAGIYAYGLGALAIRFIYICKDTDYRKGYRPGQTLEFRYQMGDMVAEAGDTVQSLVENELMRLQRISESVIDGVIPPRDIPGVGLVESPPRYMGKGQPWNCRYCRHNSTCRVMESGPVPVEFAATHVQESWNPHAPVEVAA